MRQGSGRVARSLLAFHLDLKEALSFDFVSLESLVVLVLRLFQLSGRIGSRSEAGFAVGELQLFAGLDPNFEGFTLLDDCSSELL